MQMRRVVTGQQRDGKSVFVSDEMVEATTLTLLPGWGFQEVWGSDTVDRVADGRARGRMRRGTSRR